MEGPTSPPRPGCVWLWVVGAVATSALLLAQLALRRMLGLPSQETIVLAAVTVLLSGTLLTASLADALLRWRAPFIVAAASLVALGLPSYAAAWLSLDKDAGVGPVFLLLAGVISASSIISALILRSPRVRRRLEQSVTSPPTGDTST